jgi:rhamnulose-1-phosphate aldolase
MNNLLQDVVKTAHDLWLKGWAERNAGNVSVRLRPGQIPGESLRDAPWQAIARPVPDLAGEHFLFTGTGTFMRNVELDPAHNTNVIEVDGAGARYRMIWGAGRPSSELGPHLGVHAVRKRVSDGVDRATLHTHPPNLIALSYALDLDTETLTRLLWEMHTECIVVLPMGCGFVEWLLPGSAELAEATERIMERRTLALWQYHGIVATGPDLDAAFGLIDTAEKAAGIYLKAAAHGPLTRRLGTAQLTALAEKFGVEPDAEILGPADTGSSQL